MANNCKIVQTFFPGDTVLVSSYLLAATESLCCCSWKPEKCKAGYFTFYSGTGNFFSSDFIFSEALLLPNTSLAKVIINIAAKNDSAPIRNA